MPVWIVAAFLAGTFFGYAEVADASRVEAKLGGYDLGSVGTACLTDLILLDRYGVSFTREDAGRVALRLADLERLRWWPGAEELLDEVFGSDGDERLAAGVYQIMGMQLLGHLPFGVDAPEVTLFGVDHGPTLLEIRDTWYKRYDDPRRWWSDLSIACAKLP